MELVPASRDSNPEAAGRSSHNARDDLADRDDLKPGTTRVVERHIERAAAYGILQDQRAGDDPVPAGHRGGGGGVAGRGGRRPAVGYSFVRGGCVCVLVYDATAPVQSGSAPR